MILQLYGFLLVICLVLIIIGIFRPSESAFAIIGFAFLFLLSFVLINSELEYETGSSVNTTFTYDDSNRVNFSNQHIGYDYVPWEDSTSNTMGIWLAIAAFLGFIFMLFMIKRGGKDE